MFFELLEKERQEEEKKKIEAEKFEKNKKIIASVILVVFAIIVFSAIFASYKIYTWANSEPELTPDETIAKRIRDQEQEILSESRSKFLEQQTILWDKSPAEMNSKDLHIEMSKCKDKIREDSSNPYGWIFGNYDENKALETIRTSPSPSITITGQVRAEFPNKVLIAEYHCHFKGAGYYMHTRGHAQFMNSYIPE